jgi:integrase
VAGYQRMVARAGEAAKFAFLVHSHMLRHSCGYKLANDGEDKRAIQHYLGHRCIAVAIPSSRLTLMEPSGRVAVFIAFTMAFLPHVESKDMALL